MKDFLQSEAGSWLVFVSMILGLIVVLIDLNKRTGLSGRLYYPFKKRRLNSLRKQINVDMKMYLDRSAWLKKKYGPETFAARYVIGTVTTLTLFLTVICILALLIYASVTDSSRYAVAIISAVFWAVHFTVGFVDDTSSYWLRIFSDPTFHGGNLQSVIHDHIRKAKKAGMLDDEAEHLFHQADQAAEKIMKG